MAIEHFPLTVTDLRMETPSVRHVVFRRNDGESFEFVAGQFLNIHFESDGKIIHRSYSIATSPEPGGKQPLAIAVAPVEGGRATRLLFGLDIGDEVDSSGPYGRFCLREKDEPTRVLLTATGTGVTPYLSMLPTIATLLAQDTGWEFHVLLGVQRREDLLYGAEFAAFAKAHAGFTFHACYSREVPKTAEEWEQGGYVQSRLADLKPDPESDLIYLCGNPNMIDETFANLRDAGFPSPRVRREKYISAKTR